MNENAPDDKGPIDKELIERGTEVTKALLDWGVFPADASDAAQWYLNTLSAIYVEARRFGFARDRNVVEILPFGRDDLRSIVTRNGNDEFGKIWIEQNGGVYVFSAEWADGRNQMIRSKHVIGRD